MSFHIETYRKDTLIILGQVSNQSVISDYLENNRIGNDMSLNLITELTKLRGKFHIVKFPLIDLIKAFFFCSLYSKHYINCEQNRRDSSNSDYNENK